MTFNSFVPLIFFSLFILQNVILLFSPLAGVSLEETFLYWNHDHNWFQNLFMSLNTGALFGIAKSAVWVFLGAYLAAIVTLISTRGKLKGQPLLPMIGGFIIFPLFLLIQVPLDITSLFVRDLKWRKIPHGLNQKK